MYNFDTTPPHKFNSVARKVCAMCHHSVYGQVICTTPFSFSMWTFVEFSIPYFFFLFCTLFDISLSKEMCIGFKIDLSKRFILVAFIMSTQDYMLQCHYQKGYRIYLDIMTGEKLSPVQLANMELIYRSVRPSIKRLDEGYSYFRPLRVSLYQRR